MNDQRRLIVWGSIVTMVLLLFGNAGFRSFFRLAVEKRALVASLHDLQTDHDRLSLELNRLQTDPSYTEYLIRKNLGYVKKGEVEYRLMPEERTAAHQSGRTPQGQR